MTTTATSGVASAKNAVYKARGYCPIEGRVKKARLKRGRDSERTRSCLTSDHSRDSNRPSTRCEKQAYETDTYTQRDRKTTDGKVTRVYRRDTGRYTGRQFVKEHTKLHKGWLST